MEMLEYRMPWEVVKNRTLQVKTIKYLTRVINMGKGMFHTLKTKQQLPPLLHRDTLVPYSLGIRQEQILTGNDNLILNRGHKYGKGNDPSKIK